MKLKMDNFGSAMEHRSVFKYNLEPWDQNLIKMLKNSEYFMEFRNKPDFMVRFIKILHI